MERSHSQLWVSAEENLIATNLVGQENIKSRVDDSDFGDEEESEGFDRQFVDHRLADNFKCPICHLVVRNAYQVNCCGKIFCCSCFMRHKRTSETNPSIFGRFDSSSQFTCPCCRKELGEAVQRYFQDTRSNQEIQSLKVYCTHKDSGCNWVGELRQEGGHSKSCKYKKTSCGKCDQEMLKCELELHLSDKCPMRMYECHLCGEQDTYKSITGEHKSEKCPKVVLVCKNLGCRRRVERCNMALHHRSCPMEMIKCPYSKVGCTYSTRREIMEEHVQESTEQHLSIAVKRVIEIQPKATCPVVLKCFGFSTYKERVKSWFSPAVYTCEGGYKFRLRVDPNGNGDGKGTHVSVFINIMPGEYDDTLEWPLRGKFTVCMLNQLEDRGHHEQFINFTENTGSAAYRREEEDDLGWGRKKFITPLMLKFRLHSNIQYLKDDTLYFRVNAVNLHSKTKPWLTAHCV